MKELYDLKARYIDELEKYAHRDTSPNALDVVNKLSSSVKNLCKIIKMCEEDDESAGSYDYRGMMSRSVEPGRDGSYARGRAAPRDAMVRYSGEEFSRHGNIQQKLRDMMQDVPDDQTRMDLEKIVRRLEQR